MIKIDSLEDIESLIEGAEVEGKKAGGKDGKGKLPNSFWETYSSFANTEGGVIFLGVEEKDDKFVLFGIKDISKIKQEIFNLANSRDKISENLITNDSVVEHRISGKIILSVAIPEATRQQKPVYLGGNLYKGTYRRGNEGDYLMSKNEVDKLISEKSNAPLDQLILKGFSENDLDSDSVTSYRNSFANSSHPFLSKSGKEFLISIGAWRTERSSGKEGLTVAGLLMFGKLRSIQDEFPNYILDYQEKENNSERRWEDRVTTDGNWSGNLYDFYRLVYKRLAADLKVPFRLSEGQRIDETEVHEAIRESLVNTLIHSDYKENTGVLVEKRPGSFSFRNPGTMRVPAEQAKKGSISDCRNRTIQKMFQFIGAGEQAGSGIPRIFQAWRNQDWHLPKLTENIEPKFVSLELRQLSLISENVISRLKLTFGEEKLKKTNKLGRLILSTAIIENVVTHRRISEITEDHPADISKALKKLVRNNFLSTTGDGRGTKYKIFEQLNSEGLEVNSEGLEINSEGLEINSEGLEVNSEDFKKTFEGLDGDIRTQISNALDPIRKQKKIPRELMEKTILDICNVAPISISKLSSLLNRHPNYIRQNYLKPLTSAGKIQLLHPDEPNHPKQEYKTKSN